MFNDAEFVLWSGSLEALVVKTESGLEDRIETLIAAAWKPHQIPAAARGVANRVRLDKPVIGSSSW